MCRIEILGDSMTYIVSNKDRLALIDLLNVTNNITITGLDTHLASQRKWYITATVTDSSHGFISEGESIEEAVNFWFESSSLDRPPPMSLYDMKMI
jgi:hypothetical protein